MCDNSRRLVCFLGHEPAVKLRARSQAQAARSRCFLRLWVFMFCPQTLVGVRFFCVEALLGCGLLDPLIGHDTNVRSLMIALALTETIRSLWQLATNTNSCDIYIDNMACIYVRSFFLKTFRKPWKQLLFNDCSMNRLFRQDSQQKVQRFFVKLCPHFQQI